MDNTKNTMGLTEEFVFGTLTIICDGEKVSTQGKFACEVRNGFMLVRKWNNKKSIGEFWASESNVVSWEAGKRNRNAVKQDTTTYIGKCSCGYKTRKLRDGNVVISTLDEHMAQNLNCIGLGGVEVAN